jgi:hypothetical protein
MTPNDALKFRTFSQVKVVVIVFSLEVVLGLLIWSLYNYQPAPNFYGPRVIYSMFILSVMLALVGRILLLRLLKLEA